MADDLTTGGETAYYRQIIEQYDKAAKKWETRARRIVKRYLDERPEGRTAEMRYNILWSNVETLKPAIYAQTPKCEVERRFLDKDPVGRLASEALERCISYFMGTTAFGSTMRQSRDDYLLVGRGISWVRYVPTIRAMKGEGAAEGEQLTDDEPMPPEEVTYEDVLTDYVHWQDFGHNIARTWEEVGVVWRKVYMTRKQMKARGFPDWNQIPLDHASQEQKDLAIEDGKRATVFEMWDKDNAIVVWIAKSWPKFLDRKEDPLKLDHFFPCSRPIYGTLANVSLIPVPDYVEYQDQAAELDLLTARIGLLARAIKAAGVYDASQKEVGRLLNEGVQNALIPVDSWAAMAEKGGIKGTMELLPMKDIAETLIMLYDARDKVKQDLYEITGMSDIIRGATKASETATAQQIKNNYLTLRLSEKQREMQRFVRNTIDIMGNIIALHFSLETIRKISGMKLLTNEEKQQVQQRQALAQQQAQMGAQPGQPPKQPEPLPEDIQEMMGQPSWDDVYALLQDNPGRCFRIDIQTDSTIEQDRQQEEQARVQFLQAVGSFFEQTHQIVEGNPEMAPLMGQMLSFGVRGFKIGRELEGAIDETIEKLTKAAQQPQQPKPDPAMAKVEADAKAKQAQLQQDGQLEQMRMQGEAQLEKVRAQIDAQAEAAKAQREEAQAQREADREDRRAMMEAQREQQQAMMDAQMDRFKAILDANTKVEVAEISAGATLDAAQVAAASQATEGAE